jgi:hypothetical protein
LVIVEERGHIIVVLNLVYSVEENESKVENKEKKVTIDRNRKWQLTDKTLLRRFRNEFIVFNLERLETVIGQEKLIYREIGTTNLSAVDTAEQAWCFLREKLAGLTCISKKNERVSVSFGYSKI